MIDKVNIALYDTCIKYFVRYVKKRGVDDLTTAEVLQILSNLNINISDDTLRRWAKSGLVPSPITGSRGRGKGRFSDYPAETVAHALAAYYLLKNNSVSQVADVRKRAKNFIENYFIENLEFHIRFNYIQAKQNNEEGYSYNIPIDKLVYQWLEYNFKIKGSYTESTDYDKPALTVLDFYGIKEVGMKESKFRLQEGQRIIEKRYVVDYKLKYCYPASKVLALENQNNLLIRMLEQHQNGLICFEDKVIYKDFGFKKGMYFCFRYD